MVMTLIQHYILDTQLKLFGTCIAHLGLKNPSLSEITKDMSPAVRSTYVGSLYASKVDNCFASH